MDADRAMFGRATRWLKVAERPFTTTR